MKCDLHIHSNFSDGRDDIKDVVRAAEAVALELIAVTDHFRMIGTDGLNNYVKKIATLRENCSPKVLIGIEVCMVNQDGQIDLGREERDKLDIVLVELMHGLLFNPEE
jgi:DNA polymerase (family 10)